MRHGTAHGRRLQATAAVLSQIDVLVSLRLQLAEQRHCRPQISEEPMLTITDGRHPVLDMVMAEGLFVPNDVAMGGSDGNVLLITGPNMASKSTLIRQVL